MDGATDGVMSVVPDRSVGFMGERSSIDEHTGMYPAKQA